MSKINRRNFIKKTSIAAGATMLIAQLPKQLFAGAKANSMPVGFQSWAVKDKLAIDFSGTMKMLSGMDYKLMELCSPVGYKDIGFGFLQGMKPEEIRKTVNDAGLELPSCHYGLSELTDNVDKTIEFAHGLGLSQMICSTFWLPKTATLDDYRAAADKLNKGAEKVKAAGMQCGFHNHDFEFAKLDGQLIYDALMSRFDPDLVKMQFQTEVINLGYKAADYFNKYPGRFISSHLSDWTTDKKEVPVGKGVIDWKEFFAAAKTGGVKNFFVEMDVDTFKDSINYIHSM